MRFGIVPKIAFAKLAPTPSPREPPQPALGQETSTRLWEHLAAEGYLNAEGAVQAKFNPADESFELAVPPEL